MRAIIGWPIVGVFVIVVAAYLIYRWKNKPKLHKF